LFLINKMDVYGFLLLAICRLQINLQTGM